MMAVKTGWAFTFDAAGCSGCKACQVACKDRSGLEVGRLWRRVYEVSGGGWQQDGAAWRTDAFAYNLSIGCNHCERPVCVEACPTGAMQRRADGVVLVDADRCVGCRYCAWACPYGAPQYHPAAGVMSKCDFCHDYLEQGRPPVCVAACPLRVLDVVARDGLEAQPAVEIFPLPAARLTEPALQIAAPQAALDGRSAAARLANVEELGAAHDDERALVWFTVLFQAAVGLQWGGFAASVLGLGWLSSWPSSANAIRALLAFSLPAAGLACAALLASLLHLGRAGQAWRALANWRSSALSREVWLAGVFSLLSLLAVAVGFAAPGAGGFFIWTALQGASALAGLGALASMAQVYRLRSVPAWAQQRPGRLFVQTALVLGGLGTAALWALMGRLVFAPFEVTQPVLRAAMSASILSLIWTLAWELRPQTGRRARSGLQHSPAAAADAARLRRQAVRRLAAAFGAALLALTMPTQAAGMLSLAWLLALAGELPRRAAFYLARRL